MTSVSPDPTPPDPPAIFQRLDCTAKRPYRRREYLRRIAWRVVERVLIRFSPPRAYRWRRFWLRCFGARITANCRIWPSTRVFHPWLLTMGEWTAIGPNTVIYNLGPVTIGDHSVLSQDVYVCAGTHDYTRPNLPLIRAPITIGSGVWVCAGAFICPGAVIGDNTVIGARAVVSGRVPAGVVAAGNPAKVIKQRPMKADVPSAADAAAG